VIATEATQPTIPPVLARPKNSEEPWHLGRDNVRPTPNAADFLYDELSPGMVEVGVGAASDIDPTLEKAIQSVSQAAIQHKTGIMVTRTGTGRYVVRAHPAFPSGLSASGTDEVGPCRHTKQVGPAADPRALSPV
jgi:hypothetical protein